MSKWIRGWEFNTTWMCPSKVVSVQKKKETKEGEKYESFFSSCWPLAENLYVGGEGRGRVEVGTFLKSQMMYDDLYCPRFVHHHHHHRISLDDKVRDSNSTFIQRLFCFWPSFNALEVVDIILCQPVNYTSWMWCLQMDNINIDVAPLIDWRERPRWVVVVRRDDYTWQVGRNSSILTSISPPPRPGGSPSLLRKGMMRQPVGG